MLLWVVQIRQVWVNRLYEWCGFKACIHRQFAALLHLSEEVLRHVIGAFMNASKSNYCWCEVLWWSEKGVRLGSGREGAEESPLGGRGGEVGIGARGGFTGHGRLHDDIRQPEEVIKWRRARFRPLVFYSVGRAGMWLLWRWSGRPETKTRVVVVSEKGVRLGSGREGAEESPLGGRG